MVGYSVWSANGWLISFLIKKKSTTLKQTDLHWFHDSVFFSQKKFSLRLDLLCPVGCLQLEGPSNQLPGKIQLQPRRFQEKSFVFKPSGLMGFRVLCFGKVQPEWENYGNFVKEDQRKKFGIVTLKGWLIPSLTFFSFSAFRFWLSSLLTSSGASVFYSKNHLSPRPLTSVLVLAPFRFLFLILPVILFLFLISLVS